MNAAKGQLNFHFNATLSSTKLNNFCKMSFYGRCPEEIGHHNVKMSICLDVPLSCHIFEASDWSKEGILHRGGGH